ncbi:hypothetical protein SDC9_206404 [bioreactor metagenome]|uniref:Uncharacterized protein n=1 Tax=bioreactor metagenome TaxID=1076179 RepID=A0A645JGI0_9ZZZZ
MHGKRISGVDIVDPECIREKLSAFLFPVDSAGHSVDEGRVEMDDECRGHRFMQRSFHGGASRAVEAYGAFHDFLRKAFACVHVGRRDYAEYFSHLFPVHFDKILFGYVRECDSARLYVKFFFVLV